MTLDAATGGVYFTDPASSNEEKPRWLDPLSRPSGGLPHRRQGTGVSEWDRDPSRQQGTACRREQAESDSGVSGAGTGQARRIPSVDQLTQKGPGQIDNQPDGIALDAEGNLFVAHYGMRQVQVVSPEGKLLRTYSGGNLTTSNVAFAGPGMDQLYVTGGEPGALFRLDLQGAEGLVILPARDSTTRSRERR